MGQLTAKRAKKPMFLSASPWRAATHFTDSSRGVRRKFLYFTGAVTWAGYARSTEMIPIGHSARSLAHEHVAPVRLKRPELPVVASDVVKGVHRRFLSGS
jgi:hypothetical protein